MSSLVFLLSPANCAGRRAQRALSPDSRSDVAIRLRSSDGVPLGELFAYFSGLYFRGKLAYAMRFAAPPTRDNPVVGGGVHVITPIAGLRAPDALLDADAVRAFAGAPIDVANDAYRRPLERSAQALRSEVGDCRVVLLGSVASPKYVDVLLGVFGARLLFPAEFVGRGDMSRGGLLLRQVASGEELQYVPVHGAARHGVRSPRLPPVGPRGPVPSAESSGSVRRGGRKAG